MTVKKEKAKKALSALLRFFLYAFSGMLTALPLLLPSLWFIGWIAPGAVLYLELCKKREKDSYLRAYLRGMSFFWFFAFIVFYWFIELYPLDFLGFDKASAIATVLLAILGIPLLQSIVSSLVFVGICFIRKRGFTFSHPILSALFTAALWTLSEYCHTLTWLGVPWGRLAVGQTGFLPVIQSASLFGSYFITFIMILFSCLIALSQNKLKTKEYKKGAIFAAIAAIIFICNILFGCIKISLPEEGETLTIGAVQGNIRFEDKWAEKAYDTMDTYKELTLSAALDGAELIIWPETAIPYDLTESYDLWGYFSEIGEMCETEYIATVFESDDTGVYNTARLVKKDGTIGNTVYKKQHLVPFGEYVPMEDFINAVIPPLGKLCSAMDQISPGSTPEIIETENGKLGCLICFDSIYEELCRESVREGAELICICTNDSWFSGSAALSQHNAQAQLRAVENGRFVIRAANTGISSVISPCGKILASIPDGEKGYITANVKLSENITLYTYTGNLFIVLSCIFAASMIFISIIIEKRKNTRNDCSHNSGKRR